MDVYVARQPIFDRYMNVFGYELLYRRSMNNFYEGTDDNQATAELIDNAFLTMRHNDLTGGTKAFINFSKEMLIKEIPLLLPADSIVVEVLERVEVDEDVVNACKKLSERGYLIALDDFVFNESYLPLLEIADIIKVEFPSVSHEAQRKMIKKYKDKIVFLAEKVETREEYQLAVNMGYNYFQGYFFNKPVIIKGKEINSLNVNLVKIMNLLNQKEMDYQEVAEIIETDMGLSYKLLKLANSVFYGSVREIRSIKYALAWLGIDEIKKWIYILMLKNKQVVENRELIKTCFVRAKFMELIAADITCGDRKFEYFMTGLFSSIDVLLNKDMKEAVEGLFITDDVRNALLGHDNEIKRVLNIVINHELLKWDDLASDETAAAVTQEKLMNMYIEALVWVIKLEY